MNPVKAVFKALLLGIVGAAMAFFAGTFLAIVTLLVIQVVTHKLPDYTVAYRFSGLAFAAVGFIIGLLLGVRWALQPEHEPTRP